MNKLELQALISQGEGFHIEFKESINSGLSKEIVAFANAKGGVVLIGVDDDGNIKNKALDNGDRSKIQDMARSCDPAIDIVIEAVDDEPNVLVVRIEEGPNLPYRCTGGFYSRDGASSNKRTTQEIYDMFREADRFTFDDVLCPKVDFEEYFDPNLLRWFFNKAEKEQILSDQDSLRNLGLLESVDGEPVFNNTGVLFFTKDPSFFHRHAIIQCARYKGNIKVDIEDQKDMTFDIMKNIDETLAFLRRSLDVAFTFESGNPQRIEVWEIPFQVLKEAVVNAIAHRDYVHKGTHIQVEVFDDRVSVTNFGGLMKGMSIEDLGKKSAHRNPNIVNILHRADFIEKMGTGLLRIDEELEAAGLPKAEFDINDNWFSIIFRRKVKVIENVVNEPDMEYLKPRDIMILKYCSEEPRSRSEIFEILDMSNSTLNFRRNVLPLMDKGWIRMTLPDTPSSKNQQYRTTEIGKEKITQN